LHRFIKKMNFPASNQYSLQGYHHRELIRIYSGNNLIIECLGLPIPLKYDLVAFFRCLLCPNFLVIMIKSMKIVDFNYLSWVHNPHIESQSTDNNGSRGYEREREKG